MLQCIHTRIDEREGEGIGPCSMNIVSSLLSWDKSISYKILQESVSKPWITSSECTYFGSHICVRDSPQAKRADFMS